MWYNEDMVEEKKADKDACWTLDTKSRHLVQLHEESRYYRTFHHTVFSVSMAFYSALMILQINILSDAGHKSLTMTGVTPFLIKYFAPVLVLLLFPIALTYLFSNYHFVQGDIRSKIIILQKELGFPDRFLEDKKYNDFTQKTRWQRWLIGKGHKVFIICLWILVLANVAILYTILRITGVG